MVAITKTYGAGLFCISQWPAGWISSWVVWNSDGRLAVVTTQSLLDRWKGGDRYCGAECYEYS
ncbi:hypothetical protein R69746_07022 [Paraburkholderia aspalathi]|nr:hypothetical protein R69746_07022 [Paraburkholderia aspalathi]